MARAFEDNVRRAGGLYQHLRVVDTLSHRSLVQVRLHMLIVHKLADLWDLNQPDLRLQLQRLCPYVLVAHACKKHLAVRQLQQADQAFRCIDRERVHHLPIGLHRGMDEQHVSEVGGANVGYRRQFIKLGLR